ncbi:MmcQ/YjbR family DNA-binding protein [Paenibacillus psychroresistens]|uniref:MmcQ/YjbR family DNA-binding protein n=1 Tax=Paenibacillus psychroresistens TaxID=1778678 RepID=A0A6B8RQU3_9BACL|nr:MmcQ/YjbR family DNA-binding protein [Paenibacillus psychroresistens]QGQ97863.1 MmcQ/YjbR family DNA-binding protein [Paenibacillus psychroresistens]
MNHEIQIKSSAGLALLKQIRKVCERLPESYEKIDGFGHTMFQVNEKSFVRMGEGEEDGAVLAIKATPFTQESLLQQPYYFKTPYVGKHGWVSIRVNDPLNLVEIEALIVEGYRLAAPKRLAKLLD